MGYSVGSGTGGISSGKMAPANVALPDAPRSMRSYAVSPGAAAVRHHWPWCRPQRHREGALVRWRKATWAIVIWTALMACWLLFGVLNPEGESAEKYGVFYVMAVGVGIFFIWLFGVLILTIVWLLSRPKPNTAIYGPQGQWMRVTEKEARRRVEKQGWSYRPPQLYILRPYSQQDQEQQPPYGGPPQPPPAGPGQP